MSILLFLLLSLEGLPVLVHPLKKVFYSQVCEFFEKVSALKEIAKQTLPSPHPLQVDQAVLAFHADP